MVQAGNSDRRRDLATTAGWSRSPTTSRAASGVRCRYPGTGCRHPGDLWGRRRALEDLGLVDAPGRRFAVRSVRRRRDLGRRSRRPARARDHAASRTSASCPTTATSRRTAVTIWPACSARTASRCSISGTWSRALRAHPGRLRQGRGAVAGLQDAAPRGLGRGRRACCSCRRSAGTSCSGRPARLAGRSAAIALHGQPVFAIARPDGRQVWVNFAHPDNGDDRR